VGKLRGDHGKGKKTGGGKAHRETGFKPRIVRCARTRVICPQPAACRADLAMGGRPCFRGKNPARLMTSTNSTQAPLRVRVIDAVRRKFGYKFPPLGPFFYRSAPALLPRHIDVELLHGVRAKLDLKDGAHHATYWQGTRYEYPTPQILSEWAATPGAVFFDIGSNYGWFSFFLASEFPHLTIHSFEPNPPTFAMLKGIAERNNLRKIHAWNLGLGDENTSAQLNFDGVDSGHSSFGADPTLGQKTTIEIPIETFDGWRKRAGLELPASPSWLAKIDVEGFEPRVVRGMQEALSARAFRGLAVEFLADTLEHCNSSAGELLELITRHGYVEKKVARSRGANRFFVPAPVR
jgi:FkbM family methyltransferase